MPDKPAGHNLIIPGRRLLFQVVFFKKDIFVDLAAEAADVIVGKCVMETVPVMRLVRKFFFFSTPTIDIEPNFIALSVVHQ